MIPHWYPHTPPIYDIYKTYLENLEQGPFFDASIPERLKGSEKIDLFGHSLRSGVGVPAGPLLGSRWIALAAKLGYDVITYKTIRSHLHSAHGLPNMIYVIPTGPQIAEPSPPPEQIDELTVTNSFGMPSRSPEFLLKDIDAAQKAIGPGQLLIVSVVGTPRHGNDFLDDFVRTANFAKEAGAKVIEANFSCPNVHKSEGILYMDPTTVAEFARAISKAIGHIPLVLKIGVVNDEIRMKEIFRAAAKGGARGICGLNSVSMQVKDKEGNPALGAGRSLSGVCGGAIREQALHFIRTASKIIAEDKLDLTLFGCGGILLPEHFDAFFEAGAQIAMTATGMMWDPFLALRYHQRKVHAH